MEMEFLKNICSDLSYREIAMKLNVSPRTIDNYRDSLFEKIQVKTRIGLVLFAIKSGICRP
jgi:DNA-binding NarL/FixJ family response regulator